MSLTDPDTTITEQQVREFLSINPHFFKNNESLLLELDLPDVAAGSAVSLIERQICMLRSRIELLEQTGDVLKQRGQAERQLVITILRRLISLNQADDATSLYTILRESLYSLFDADCFYFHVFSDTAVDPGESFIVRPFHHHIKNEFTQIFNVGRSLIDSLQDEHLQDLFPGHERDVHASLLLPIQHCEWDGLVVLGSQSSDRYGQGVELKAIECLVEVAATRLDQWLFETD